jgi:hypothetical protein
MVQGCPRTKKLVRLYQKNNYNEKGWGMAQRVEGLSSKSEYKPQY